MVQDFIYSIRTEANNPISLWENAKTEKKTGISHMTDLFVLFVGSFC